jgi:dephospho-CoA kinase
MEELKLNSANIRLNAKTRLYELDIPIIGLTGGIATGKSTVSNILRDLGSPIIDADGLIKYIYNQQDTIAFIQSVSPNSILNNKINFQILRKDFFSNSELKLKIENYLYSKLPNAFNYHLSQLNNPSFVIYDVPLLFEKFLEKEIDFTILVFAPRNIQLDRVLARDNCSVDTANKILDYQDAIESKCDKASFVVDNSQDISHLKEQIQLLRSTLFQN